MPSPDWLMPLRQCEWVVYAKRPFAGPEQDLAYLSRYTHRVATSNSRLIAFDERGGTFRWNESANGGGSESFSGACPDCGSQLEFAGMREAPRVRLQRVRVM